MRTAIRMTVPVPGWDPMSRQAAGDAGGKDDRAICHALPNLLSPRECEIAEMVAFGLSNKEVALRLGISHWTVSTHLRRIFAKLDINCRVELCRVVTACTG